MATPARLRALSIRVVSWNCSQDGSANIANCGEALAGLTGVIAPSATCQAPPVGRKDIASSVSNGRQSTNGAPETRMFHAHELTLLHVMDIFIYIKPLCGYINIH
jgi:hypothetical protein